MNGMDEALSGELSAESEDEQKNEEEKKIETHPVDSGIGDAAAAKLNEAVEAGKSANELIAKFGGSEKAQQALEYLQSEEFRTLYNKSKENPADSPAEGDERAQAVKLIEDMISKATNPLQSQIAQLSKVSTGRIGELENTLATTNITSALERIAEKNPDLADYREGIVKHIKELFPKGNFTEENVKNVYLLAKIKAGKIGNEPNPDENKAKLEDLSKVDLLSISKTSKGKDFSQIGKEIMDQVS